jgi:hypothetical protein
MMGGWGRFGAARAALQLHSHLWSGPRSAKTQNRCLSRNLTLESHSSTRRALLFPNSTEKFQFAAEMWKKGKGTILRGGRMERPRGGIHQLVQSSILGTRTQHRHTTHIHRTYNLIHSHSSRWLSWCEHLCSSARVSINSDLFGVESGRQNDDKRTAGHTFGRVKEENATD